MLLTVAALIVGPMSLSTFNFAPGTGYLGNPNRGYRMQIDNGCLPGDAGRLAVEEGLQFCQTYNLTTTLFYCYISDYWNTSLPQSFLDDFSDRFAMLREADVSVVLNVAYMDGKANFSMDPEPFHFEQIYEHIEQLAPVLYKNSDQIHSVQAGFLGNAGEWAHDMHNLTSNGTGLAGMVARLLYSGALPDDRYVHIRKPTEKREWLLASALPLGTPKPDNWQIGVVDSGSARSQASYARLGYYNAAFMSVVGDGGGFDSHTLDDSNPWFKLMTAESPWVAIDGEMYYGTPWPAKQRLLVDGHGAAFRMFQHHYTTFSHHNSFWPLDTEVNPDPKNKSLNVWMQTPLNVDFIRDNRMPITDEYAAAALKEHKTVYHYIRDHLGYRLQLKSINIAVDAAGDRREGGGGRGASAAARTVGVGNVGPQGGGAATRGTAPTLHVALEFNNQGFSAPINRRLIEFVLIGVNSNIITWSAVPTDAATGADADWRSFQPHSPGDPLFVPINHTLTLAATIPGTVSGGTYHLGLSIREPLELGCSANNAVKFANDGLEYWLQHPGAARHSSGGGVGSCYNGTAILGNVVIQ